MADSIPDEVKTERLKILMDRHGRFSASTMDGIWARLQECMVESYNTARGQVVGRSSQKQRR